MVYEHAIQLMHSNLSHLEHMGVFDHKVNCDEERKEERGEITENGCVSDGGKECDRMGSEVCRSECRSLIQS